MLYPALTHLPTYSARYVSATARPRIGSSSPPTRRASTSQSRGGSGVIVCHGSGLIDPKGGAVEGRISLWDARNEGAQAQIADRAHEHGAWLISQSVHRGRSAGHRILGFNDRPQVAPSDVPALVGEYPRVLTKRDIRELIASWVDLAARLERCEFDGIQVTTFGDQLIQQFWSPETNRRTDEYGGDPTNRMRFSTELVSAIREAVSSEFLISIRMSGDFVDAGAALRPDLLDIVRRLDALEGWAHPAAHHGD